MRIIWHFYVASYYIFTKWNNWKTLKFIFGITLWRKIWILKGFCVRLKNFVYFTHGSKFPAIYCIQFSREIYYHSQMSWLKFSDLFKLECLLDASVELAQIKFSCKIKFFIFRMSFSGAYCVCLLQVNENKIKWCFKMNFSKYFYLLLLVLNIQLSLASIPLMKILHSSIFCCNFFHSLWYGDYKRE